MKLLLPVYNAHPYFSLKNLGNKCALYTAKYSNKNSEEVMHRLLCGHRDRWGELASKFGFMGGKTFKRGKNMNC